MPGEITIKAMSAWENDIELSLSDVLRVSMDTMERTGDEACKHAIILMAQSARAMTPKAPARRKVEANPTFRHLLVKDEPGSTYKEAGQAGRRMGDYFRFTATRSPTQYAALYGNKPSDISQISKKMRGLAQRSWTWGLSALGGREMGKPIDGASAVYTINQEMVHGYIKENRLGYIQAIMPGGWEAEVSTRAENKIMGQARARLEQLWPSVAEGAVK